MLYFSNMAVIPPLAKRLHTMPAKGFLAVTSTTIWWQRSLLRTEKAHSQGLARGDKAGGRGLAWLTSLQLEGALMQPQVTRVLTHTHHLLQREIMPLPLQARVSVHILRQHIHIIV